MWDKGSVGQLFHALRCISWALEITWSCEHKDYFRTVDGQGKNTHMQRFEKWALDKAIV